MWIFNESGRKIAFKQKNNDNYWSSFHIFYEQSYKLQIILATYNKNYRLGVTRSKSLLNFEKCGRGGECPHQREEGIWAVLSRWDR